MINETNPMRRIRKRLGWTQARLAHELGITVGAVARKERGERPVTQTDLLAMEALLQRQAEQASQ